MQQDGEWADHVILVATAHLLRRDIMVVTSSPQSQGDQMVCWIRCAASFTGQPIMLGHLWEWHYQSLQTARKLFVADLDKIDKIITLNVKCRFCVM